jgi:hypothetical protein
MDPVSKFVQVSKAQAAIPLQVFSVGNIVGCAHVIPEFATSSKTGDGWNEQWIVNSHIDLATWNDVYNKYRELHFAARWKEHEERYSQRHPSHCNPDANVYPMNSF